jgi:chaperonin GroEL
MEFNHPSDIVKDLNFGNNASNKIMAGVNKLNEAVKSTLGASGKCVIYEDGLGRPIVTKDGVTVANSVILRDPVENIGATLIKEAAQKTVKEAGDGTTTSTVLASAVLNEYYKSGKTNIRGIKAGIAKAVDKTIKYLDKVKVPVEGAMLSHVANISTNNDIELGSIISDAYTKVGKDGVVLMEESETSETHVEIVDGVQFDSGLKSPHLITNKEKGNCTLEDPLVLLVESEVSTIRKIQTVLEYAIKEKRSILIIGNIAQQPLSALIMNKVKGNIKVNVVDSPGFSLTRKELMEDLASITGATIINEDLGDDLDLIGVEHLGVCRKSVTDDSNTVITVDNIKDKIEGREESIDKQLKEEKNDYVIKKLEERKAMLSGSVGIIKVGADSKVALKEKKDRVEDAIYAVKAALKEGIVPGGGIALCNAADNIKPACPGEEIMVAAMKEPFNTILKNSGIAAEVNGKNKGIDVTTGKVVNMIRAGIIDPVLVTKTALKNAASVASTIISADCVISNMREDEGNQ